MNASPPNTQVSALSSMALGDPVMELELPSAAPAAPGGIDIRRLVRRLVKGLPVIGLFVLGGLALGVVALRLLPAKYTSSVSILIDPKRPDSLGADAAFANLYVDSGRVANVEQILVSSSLLSKVVLSQGLLGGGAAPPSAAARLSALLQGRPAQGVDTPDARMAKAVDALAKSIRITRVGLTYVMKVDVTAATAALARGNARALIDAYLADQLQTKYAAAQADMAWLANRLRDQRRAVMASEAAVESVRQKYGIVETDLSPGSTLDRQAVTSLNADLVTAEADVAAARARYGQVSQVLRRGGNLEALSNVVASKVIESLRIQQAAANRRVADLSRRFTPEYSEVQAARADRDTLNGQIAMEVFRITDGLRNDYETAVARRNTLAAQIKQMVDTTATAGSAVGRVALHEAERVAESDRQAYEAALKQMRDVEQQQTHQEVEARIISPAELPDAPSFPRPSLFLPGGGALGLFSGVALVLLAPLLRNRVTDREDAQELVSLPVLSMVPALKRRDWHDGGSETLSADYLIRHPFSPFAESLRLLRLGLRASTAGRQVIQVTSSVPNEGKSTIAASLAASSAAAGKRTVLVELDFHKPTVRRMFRDDASCLSEGPAVWGTNTPYATRTHNALPLQILTMRQFARPWAGMLENGQLGRLIEHLSEQFDLVVLDTPPVLAISDSIWISHFCTATVMVIAWCDTPRDRVREAVAALRAAHAPLAGLVLNKVNTSKAGMYGERADVYENYAGA